MKKQKRITTLALSLLLGSMTVLSACSATSGNTANTPVPTGVSPDVGDSAQSEKVALITSAGGLEDESFNQSAWEGLQRTSGTYGCGEIYLETRSGTVFSDNLDKAISEGADLCWGIGYSCAEDMLKAANDHPDISFGVIDNYFDNTPDNLTGIMFRAQESSFLVGYIAGRVTESGRVGFVGGVPGEIMDQFQYGYQAGAAYAAKESGKEVLVKAVYADTYSDAAAGRELASELYDEGCDIVFQAAGQTGIGVIDEAKERGKYVIGVDKDQSYLAPFSVLTSALKYVSVALYTTSGDFLSGKDIGGQTISLGLAEGAVGVSSQHSLYSDEIYETMLTLKDDIVNGKLVPPANEDDYETFLSEVCGQGT